MSRMANVCAAIAAALSASGCVVLAAAGAGYVAHDEATENDGKFDPLEKARGEDDGKN